MTSTINNTTEKVDGEAQWVKVAGLNQLQAAGRLTVRAGNNVVALFMFDGRVYAVDNRCPHMGFPLDKGTVQDGILTCHWHHARFELASGGTFDQFADDVRSFPVRVEDEAVWLDIAPAGNYQQRLQQRLKDGLERNIRLVIAKSVLGMMKEETNLDSAALTPFATGLEYGARNRRGGWSTGQTILTVLHNLVPYLDDEDKPRAMYLGLNAVARDCDGQPPLFAITSLPGHNTSMSVLKAWFRQFVEVRDSEGAERCLVTAVRAGHPASEIASMLFAAATDHRFLDVGHVLDFTNKAFEALDQAGWHQAEVVLASLVPVYTGAERQEETSPWRNPVNLVIILEEAFGGLGEALERGRGKVWDLAGEWDRLVDTVLSDNPAEISAALLAAVESGASPEELAQVAAYAALRRVAQFHITNEFGDWNTVHHTFTYANALHQAMRRSPSPELLRGVWDAAMSIYLDRFLNVPATRLPQPGESEIAAARPDVLLQDLLEMFNRQQQVNQAGELIACYLAAGGDHTRLIATLGKALLREDAGFHSIQALEAAVRQYYNLKQRPATAPFAPYALVAAGRFMGAHFPTPRAANQTYQIARRLQRGEKVFEE